MTVPPLGVTLRTGGADVAVCSGRAETIEFCIFDEHDAETGRLLLPHRDGDIFHGFVPGVTAGTRYGLRAHGPFAPWQGDRFNANKLLLDPYAMRIDRPFRLHPSLFDTGETPSAGDSAPFMPKGLVCAPPEAADIAPPPDWPNLIIYELHVRGFSKLNEAVPQALRGTFAGLAHPASVAYLQRLGITAVEIMPCAAWVDERHLPPLGLGNYWGYNPVNFCAPDPRLAPGGFADIRASVTALREAGIATIIDVVFNHTGESDGAGPTLSLRGLDNAGYYRLRPDDAHYYINDAGCGNVLATDRPAVVRMILDALRLWVYATGADGFRFDLALTLGRHPTYFDSAAPFLTAIAQDPVLRGRILIAEPWDIGPGGYQLGNFAAPWAEWNDKYRDVTRRFWRGDAGLRGDMATRLAGSADIFAPSHRTLSHSVNYLTAHDGFTLRDLVSYSVKHNEANGEQNHDGTDSNCSWNHGVEGDTEDAAIGAARACDARALLATLLFSRGTPMLTMGDEAGRTQGGNNNAYAQDCTISWLDWNGMDPALLTVTQQLIALRRATPALHSGRPLTGVPPDGEIYPDIAWLRADGTPMQGADWQDAGTGTLIALLYSPPNRVLLVLHPGWQGVTVTIPPARPGHGWQLAIDTSDPARADWAGATLEVAPRCVVLLLEQQTVSRATGAADQTVRLLATQAGLSLAWWDVAGTLHPAPMPTLRALLAAQNLSAATEADARDSLSRLATRRDLPTLPPALVVTEAKTATLRLGAAAGGRDRWLTIEGTSGEGTHGEGTSGPVSRLKIAAEDGLAEAVDTADGRRITARRITLPTLKPGRYLLRVEGLETATRLTIAPVRCHTPPSLANGGRSWGIAAHLYTLRHQGDQGVGDFTALTELAGIAGDEGASLLGLNPLHALFARNRERASPYHPSDRRFLDPIYIDVMALGPLSDAPAVRAALEAVAAPLAAIQSASIIDYPAVWRIKQRVLQAAFAALPAASDMAAELDGFIAAGGEKLRNFTLWEALHEANDGTWQDWAADVRTPHAPGITAFATSNAASLRYSAFLQFLAELGLAGSAAAARTAGLQLGLYRDIAVGCAPDGAEAWSEQSLLLTGASVGAPPDALGPMGQIWHLPPPDPLAMAEEGYRSFAGLLTANMRHAGALRIDHVMGLTRLFLIPAGGDARDGTYLNYPLSDLLGQVTLESRQAGCLVVGEDLGTVPPELETALAGAGILSYRVLWFEQEGGHFRPPAAWPARAAACVSTHDLPTLAGWWEAADIDEQVVLGVVAPAAEAVARAARAAAKASLLDLLRQENLWSSAAPDAPPMEAIHALIARTPSALALVQADDLAGERVAVNLPGTDTERPNWRRRLGCTAAAFSGNEVLAAMRQERG